MSKARPLTKKELDSLSEILASEKRRLIFRNVYVSDDFNFNQEDMSDEVDHASRDQSNAQRLRFRNRESFYEKKIDEALRRFKEGSYGLCQECDEHIGFKRLQARPTAELCIACKEETERDESNSILGKTSKSLGKGMEIIGANVR